MNDKLGVPPVLERLGVLSSVKIGDVGLCDIACVDPQLAHTFLQPIIHGELVGAYGGLEIINLVGEFTSGTADQTIAARQTGTISGDLWVRKVVYTVRRPNAFAGNIFKGESDHYNALNPNVDFELLINAYCKYVIAADPTPIENIELAFECCPIPIILGCNASFHARFTLNRALAAEEIPYEIIVSIIGTRLPGNYAAFSKAKCIEALRAVRVLPPGV